MRFVFDFNTIKKQNNSRHNRNTSGRKREPLTRDAGAATAEEGDASLDELLPVFLDLVAQPFVEFQIFAARREDREIDNERERRTAEEHRESLRSVQRSLARRRCPCFKGDLGGGHYLILQYSGPCCLRFLQEVMV